MLEFDSQYAKIVAQLELMICMKSKLFSRHQQVTDLYLDLERAILDESYRDSAP